MFRSLVKKNIIVNKIFKRTNTNNTNNFMNDMKQKIIEFDNNLEIKKYYYLDETRAKTIIFNQ